MSNELLRKNLIIKIKGAVEEAKLASLISHAYLVGKIREIVVSDLFKPVLSDNFSIGSGKITDTNGLNSNETDVVIFSRRLIPPLMFSSDFGYYPKESVFASIEVKSNLTSGELDDAENKFKQLDKLKMMSGFYDEKHQGQDAVVIGVIKSLFAFSSDLTDKNELDRLLDKFPECKESPFLNSICVVGKGYWSFDFRQKQWLHTPPSDDFDEVIRFLSSLTNGLNDALLSRGNPRIGGYFTDINPKPIN